MGALYSAIYTSDSNRVEALSQFKAGNLESLTASGACEWVLEGRNTAIPRGQAQLGVLECNRFKNTSV
ncbi:hypothetical protein BaRGS_00037359, partial [Batillaria attramentaria]